MKGKFLIITIVVAVIFAAGGFFGGMQYQKNKKPSFGGNIPGAFGSPGAGGPMARGSAGKNNGGDNSGEIISKDDKSLTIKTSDGSTKIIYFSDSTQVAKTETGSKDDLSTGTKVVVMGASNSDGSVTAQNIQIQK